MSAQFLDLGRATFTLTKANLQVEMKASALLRPEMIGSSGLNSAQSVEQRSSYRDCWISKGPNLHFSFCFSSDEECLTAAGSKDRYLDHLGPELEAAQLWSQLCLQPSLSVCEQNDPDVEVPGRHFTLALKDEHTKCPCPSAISPRTTSQQIDVANLRAPGGFPTIHLVSVKISLHFSLASPNRPRQRLKVVDSELSSKVENPFDDGLFLTQWPFAAAIHVPKQSQTTTTEVFKADKFSCDEQNTGADGCFEDFESSFVREARAGKAADSIEESRDSSSQRYCEATSRLTDAAFRNLICARPIRIMPGIKSSAGDGLSHLTSLAPVIFIPGYAEAVKARSDYIPAITKVLSRFLDQPRTATQHKQKEVLLRCDIGTGDVGQPVFTGKDWRKRELEEVLKGHLWMTLANGVRKVEAARRLKPLHISRVGGATDVANTAFEDLFCSGIMPRCPDIADPASSIGIEFDSLFPGRDGEDLAITEDEHFSDLYDEALSRSAPEAVQRQGHLSETKFDYIIEDAMPGMTVDSKSSPIVESGEDFTGFTSIGESILVTNGNDRQATDDSAESQVNKMLLGKYCNEEMRNAIGGWPGGFENVIRPDPHDLFENFEDHHLHTATSTLRVCQGTDCHLCFSDSINRKLSSGIPEVRREHFSNEQHPHELTTEQSVLDIYTEMPTYERSSRSSLSDILGGEHLMWHMRNRRRPSVDPADDDMLELHAMYERDTDMRLLSPQETSGDENIDGYILDSEITTNVIHNPTTPPPPTHEAFIYGPGPIQQQSSRQKTSTSSTNSASSSPFAADERTRPAPRRKLSRGHSFLKRLSFGKSSLDEASEPLRRFSRDEPRDVEIKRRKTMADYEAPPDGDEMLMR